MCVNQRQQQLVGDLLYPRVISYYHHTYGEVQRGLIHLDIKHDRLGADRQVVSIIRNYVIISYVVSTRMCVVCVLCVVTICNQMTEPKIS